MAIAIDRPTSSSIPLGWDRGSEVEIYSRSLGEWFAGRVNDIYNDHEGEWLRVTYICQGNIRMKDVSRFDTAIRPRQSKLETKQPQPPAMTENERKEDEKEEEIEIAPSSNPTIRGYETLEEIFRLNDEEARTFYALRLLEEYRQMADEQDMIRYRSYASRISKMEEQARNAERARSILSDDRGWSCQVKDKNDISVFYRREDNSNIHSLKIVMRTVADPIHIFTIVREIDLLPHLFGELSENRLMKLPKPRIKILDEVSPRHLFIYGAGQITTLMKARDGIVEVYGIDAMDEYGEWLVVGQSVREYNGMSTDSVCRELERRRLAAVAKNGTTNGGTPKSERVHRIEIKFACSSLRYVNKKDLRDVNSEIEVKAYFNIDVHSPIPQSVINFLSRNFAHMCSSLFRKKCEQFDYSSPYGDRLATRSYYTVWRRRMEAVKARRRRGFL